MKATDDSVADGGGQSEAVPEVVNVPKKRCSFEEWCDKLQRFSIRTAVWSALGTLGVALVCGVVYLIAMWQLAD